MTRLGSLLRPAVTRRTMLKGGLIAGAGLATVPWIGGTRAESPTLRKYVSRLTIPELAQPQFADGIAHYRIEMTEFLQNVHPDLPPTRLWGYGGAWPGPPSRCEPADR